MNAVFLLDITSEETITKRSFTHRNKPCLIVGDYCYFINNRRNEKTYWICSKNRSIKCSARLVTVVDKATGRDIIVKRNDIHTHITLKTE